MKLYALKPFYLKITPLFVALFLFTNISFSQVTVEVTVKSGTSTTTCTDNFSNPDPHWRVNIENQGWTTYPATNFCYQDPPFLQFTDFYTCGTDIPEEIQICFRSFEDDGSFCTPSHACDEIICEFFPLPQTGTSENHTLGLANGLSSGGEVNFTIEASGIYPGPPNDYICNATNLGLLTSGATLGDASSSAYTNFCASNNFDPPSTGFGNEQMVWFSFTTGADPSYTIVNAVSDPSGFGDDIVIQMVLYSSDDGTCSGNLNFELISNNSQDNDEIIELDCLEPNTTYFLGVDGSSIVADGIQGVFGLEIVAPDAMNGADLPCDAADFGQLTDNGSLTMSNQTNVCSEHLLGEPNSAAFVSQKSVWYQVTTPSSGHVIIEAESDVLDVYPIGLQIAAFVSSTGDCNGVFTELNPAYDINDNDEIKELQCLEPETTLWIQIDGTGALTVGIFNLTVSDGGPVLPQSITEQDVTLCQGETVDIGGSTFDTSGPYSITLSAFNGCDSVVQGMIDILPPLSSSNDTIICSGESIVVGTSNYSVTGVYQDVLVTDDGCDSLVTTDLTVTSLLTLDASQTVEATNYQVFDGEATVVASGGANGFTYEWSDGQTGTTGINLEGGTNYCVTVTDAIGCTAEDCVLILFPSNILTTVDDVLLDCPGDANGELNLSVSNGAAPYNYAWENLDNPATNGSGTIIVEGGVATLNNLATGMYSFTISDAFGLTIAIGSVIEPSPIFTNLNEVICPGEVLAVGGVDYVTTGPVSEMLISSLGCDSIVGGFVTVLDPIGSSLDETICFGESLTVGTAVYTSSGPISEVVTAFNGCDSTITGNLTVLPQVLTQIDTTVCFGETITVNGTVYSQTNIFTEVANAFNACDSIINVNLVVQTPIDANVILTTEATGPNISDGEASSTPTGGSGNYTYQWSNGGTSNTASNLLAGDNYCVTVTDNFDCSVVECVLVTFPSNIEVSVANTAVNCFGDTDGSLLLDVELGLAPYTYNWQNADNSLNGNGTINTQNADELLNGLLPGTYFITVADAFGEATTQATIGEPLALATVVSTVETSCFSECDGTASVLVEGGTTPYQYFWPNGTVNMSTDGLCFGSYEVTVVDANGCSATSLAAVTQPDELIVTTNSPSGVSCVGGDDGQGIAVINGQMSAVLWDNGEESAIAVNLSAGVHSVVVTDDNGCTATGSVTINEPADPLSVNIDLLRSVTCFDGNDGSLLAVPVGGISPYTYLWNEGTTIALLNELGEGMYEVTVTDANGCTTIFSESVDAPSEIVSTFDVKEVTCPEGENSGRIAIDTTVGGAGAYIYSVDGLNFSTDTAFAELTAGEYTLSVQDIEGCIATFPIVVGAPDPIFLELDDPQTIDLGESFDLNPTYFNNDLVFEWTGLQATDCIDCPDVRTIPTAPTVYEVLVTDTTTLCTATAEQRVNVILKRDVYIPNAFSPNGDGTNDFFYVNAGPEVAQINSLKVFNRWGAAVYTLTNIQPNDQLIGWDGRFKGKALEGGVYIYVAEIQFIDGELLRYEGDISIMR